MKLMLITDWLWNRGSLWTSGLPNSNVQSAPALLIYSVQDLMHARQECCQWNDISYPQNKVWISTHKDETFRWCYCPQTVRHVRITMEGGAQMNCRCINVLVYLNWEIPLRSRAIRYFGASKWLNVCRNLRDHAGNLVQSPSKRLQVKEKKDSWCYERVLWPP